MHDVLQSAASKCVLKLFQCLDICAWACLLGLVVCCLGSSEEDGKNSALVMERSSLQRQGFNHC